MNVSVGSGLAVMVGKGSGVEVEVGSGVGVSVAVGSGVEVLVGGCVGSGDGGGAVFVAEGVGDAVAV